jgi:hypothetical protein
MKKASFKVRASPAAKGRQRENVDLRSHWNRRGWVNYREGCDGIP